MCGYTNYLDPWQFAKTQEFSLTQVFQSTLLILRGPGPNEVTALAILTKSNIPKVSGIFDDLLNLYHQALMNSSSVLLQVVN